MDVSAADFRTTMRHTASGIAIITTIDSGEMYGFTASSFTSLSLAPPMVLFCLNNNSRSLIALRNSGLFSVSVLSEKQESVSKNFATQGLNKFAKIDYITGPKNGCPLIKDAICSLECSVLNEYNGGDHRIMTGLVKAVHINNNQDPLIYFSGDYHSLAKQ